MDISETNKQFIKEVVRQITHPKTGTSSKLSPSPVTLGDWEKCLSRVNGWVNLGITDKMATIFNNLQIGEVIPITDPNMDIYQNSFCTQIISKLLGLTRTHRNYRAVLNYYSFSRLLKILTTSQTKTYCDKFNTDIKKVFTDITPRTFWVNVLVTEETAGYLRANEIGEVIVKDGGGKRFSIKDSDMDGSKSDVYRWLEEDSDNMQVETKKAVESMTDTNDDDNDDYPFRLVVNNYTLFKLIRYACKLQGNMDPKVNVYESMGGEKEDFFSLFGKLKI